MLANVPNAPKFFDKKDICFCELHNAYDDVYRALHSQGIGTDIAHTALFTAEEEDRCGLLGCSLIVILRHCSGLFSTMLANTSV